MPIQVMPTINRNSNVMSIRVFTMSSVGADKQPPVMVDGVSQESHLE